MTVDNVIDLFRSVSDFDERMTRYQVEHIAGGEGPEQSIFLHDAPRYEPTESAPALMRYAEKYVTRSPITGEN